MGLKSAPEVAGKVLAAGLAAVVSACAATPVAPQETTLGRGYTYASPDAEKPSRDAQVGTGKIATMTEERAARIAYCIRANEAIITAATVVSGGRCNTGITAMGSGMTTPVERLNRRTQEALGACKSEAYVAEEHVVPTDPEDEISQALAYMLDANLDLASGAEDDCARQERDRAKSESRP